MEVVYNQKKNQVLLIGPIYVGDKEKIKKVFSEASAGFSVKLNSPGGVLLEALNISALIEECRADVFVDGNASSAAIFLLLGGKRRSARDGSQFLFHIPLDEETGKKESGLIQPMANVIHAYTGMSVSDATSFIEREYRMGVDEAIKYGLIHEKIKSMEKNLA